MTILDAHYENVYFMFLYSQWKLVKMMLAVGDKQRTTGGTCDYALWDNRALSSLDGSSDYQLR